VTESDVRWLTPDELSAWLVYVATTSLLDGALDRQLQRDSGMPMAYYLILAMLSDVPGRTLRMSDLAAVTQSSQSRLSHAVSKLERNGWVRRSPCPDDRRSTLAQLTDAGYHALVAAAPGHVQGQDLGEHLGVGPDVGAQRDLGGRHPGRPAAGRLRHDRPPVTPEWITSASR